MRLIVWNVTKRKDRYLLNIIYIYFIQTTLYLYTTYYVKYHFTKTLSCIHGHNTRRWCCCSASTPLGETCLRMDLTAIHKNLENLAYKDDEGVTTEVLLFWFDLFFSKSTFMSFMIFFCWKCLAALFLYVDKLDVEMLNSKKKRDVANVLNFQTAIDYYMQAVENVLYFLQ